MALQLFRVVVRGRFDGLDDAARDRLREVAADHDIMVSAFTGAGTLTYDHFLYAYNARFELRADGDDPQANVAEVTERALRGTTALLAELDVSGRDQKVTVTDMASIWS